MNNNSVIILSHSTKSSNIKNKNETKKFHEMSKYCLTWLFVIIVYHIF